MTGGMTIYNERSWAIDLIGYLKQVAHDRHRAVRGVGGEQTVKGDGGSLFPDVLLFGDLADAVVLQGWELKMPDTSIDDPDFRENAEYKARQMGLDSYVLWNVRRARLYALDREADRFAVIEEWDDLDDITARTEVKPAQARWEAVAVQILTRVNDLLETGELEGRPFIDAYRSESGGVASMLLANRDAVADALEAAVRNDGRLRAGVTLWWNRFRDEYGGKEDTPAYPALAQANLVNWIGKLLFAHVLRQRDNRAAAVEQIGEDTSPAEAIALFEKLYRACNFWTIFCDSVGLSTLPPVAWSHLKQFNNLLSDLNIGAVDQQELSGVLEAAASVGTRKLRGQYVTPKPLADLLARLTTQNTEGRFLDPCCGSGTIARAAMEMKLDAGMQPEDVAAGVFAGDLDPQAIQLATFALAKPSLMSLPLRLFTRDAFDLKTTTELGFRDPNNGRAFTEQMGKFHAIASNLPFVAQKGRERYGNAIASVNDLLDDDFTGRADVAAYLPFALHGLLEEGGRLGIIITNAWLGTAWGREFRQKIGPYYRLRAVITSGAGRWFQNSDVVTNLLVLEKLTGRVAAAGEDETHFVVLKRPINELNEQEAVAVTAAQIELGQTQEETLTIRSVKPSELEQFEALGLTGNAQFVDVEWVRELPLKRLADFFDVRRGERRGWNAMFYPAPGHGIEADYIRPALRSSSDVTGYVTRAQNEAFSCSATIQELEERGHTGALAWIARFQDSLNNSGRPLVESLARAGHHWYEMRAADMTELVTSMNPGDRLFFGRLQPAGFVDQRLIRLLPEADSRMDVDLGHALLNSTLTLFMVEGIGFGRGLGALDLNPTTLKRSMHIPDAGRIDRAGRQAIIDAFRPVRDRDVLDLADELEQSDRRALDQAVLDALGAAIDLDRIYEAMLNLVAIRQAATA